jgi:uncharacterized membrane protein
LLVYKLDKGKENYIELFNYFLALTTLLCTLVAGLLFTFAVIVMPGISNLSDKGFLKAFIVMDRIIQNNNPFFMIVWVGSIFSNIITLILGINQLSGINLIILITASLLYFLAVQLPTVLFNIPLNNRLQSLKTDSLDDGNLRTERLNFENNWNRWNLLRTVVSVSVSIFLLFLLVRI